MIELGFNELQIIYKNKDNNEKVIKIEKEYEDKNKNKQRGTAKIKLDSKDNIGLQATDKDCL